MHRRLSVVLLLLCLVFACSTCSFAKEVGHISAGDALEGTNKVVYDYLSEQIRQVAAGNVTQTQFFVYAKDLGLDQIWTAKDLHVDYIWEDTMGPNGTLTTNISTATREALQERLDFDLDHIMNALIFDYPYELYWYDKTYGASEASCYSGTRSFSGKEDTVQLTYFSFLLAVSQDYAVIEGNAVYIYQPDPAKQAKASAALAEAKHVVDANVGKTDYEKLVAYKNYICDATSYNDFAAVTVNYPYGDPWQLISVFDDDPTTTVVCEGYAKAFQLLCDLTDFGRDVQCILVDGEMHDGTGAGSHMWNIVQIEGDSYLVDVTNCDTNTIGYPSELFLVGSDKKGDGNDCDFLVDISQGDTIKYTYDDITHLLWDNDLLELTKEDFDPTQVLFNWSADFRSCMAAVNGQMLPCTVNTQQEDARLTLTASVEYNGKIYTDKEIIQLNRDELVLPKLFDQQEENTVWILIASYEEGRLTDLQLVETMESRTYDLSAMEGDIQVFFLSAANQAPLLPALNIH